MKEDGYGWLEGLKLARHLRTAGPAQHVICTNQADWRLTEDIERLFSGSCL